MSESNSETPTMERDLNLCREILIQIQSQHPDAALQLQIKGVESSILLYHLELLCEAGLLEGRVDLDGNNKRYRASIRKLKWEGHQFVDATKDPMIWKKVLAKFSGVTTAWSWEKVLEFATSFIEG